MIEVDVSLGSPFSGRREIFSKFFCPGMPIRYELMVQFFGGREHQSVRCTMGEMAALPGKKNRTGREDVVNSWLHLFNGRLVVRRGKKRGILLSSLQIAFSLPSPGPSRNKVDP